MTDFRKRVLRERRIQRLEMHRTLESIGYVLWIVMGAVGWFWLGCWWFTK